jgi:hypothetical protein
MMSTPPRPPPSELFPIEKDCVHTEYEKYFKGKRQNFFLSLTAFRPLWDCLQLLNDIWMREMSDLEHLSDEMHLLPKTIFSSAHARYLNAIELAFSSCIGDAYSILRDGIEAVAHAAKMVREPTTIGHWTNKHKGKIEEGAYKKIFEEKKKGNLFPNWHGLRQLHVYYAQFCEMATHTSMTSLGRGFVDKSVPGQIVWGFNYFETNPQRLAALFRALLLASAHMEEVFFRCFETRLDLDPELVRMREEFRAKKIQQARYLIQIYKTPAAKKS